MRGPAPPVFIAAVAITVVLHAEAQETCWYDAKCTTTNDGGTICDEDVTAHQYKTCSGDAVTSAASCTNGDTLTAEYSANRPPGCECDGFPNACDCKMWFMGEGLPYTLAVLGCCVLGIAISLWQKKARTIKAEQYKEGEEMQSSGAGAVATATVVNPAVAVATPQVAVATATALVAVATATPQVAVATATAT
jgi:hypothetical protein